MLIIGNDFHSRYERIALLDAETGECQEREVVHSDAEIRKFYAGLVVGEKCVDEPERLLASVSR